MCPGSHPRVGKRGRMTYTASRMTHALDLSVLLLLPR
jgi:hypothetical protein